MKTPLLLVAMSLVMGVNGQENQTEENREKKVEIIKIIDGDTVVHKVTTVRDIGRPEAGPEERMKRMEEHRVMMDVEMDELNSEIREILENIDIYVNVDDMHKKMIIRRITREGDINEIIESLDSDDNIVIDFEDGKRTMKVMKIQIDSDDMEELAELELGQSKTSGRNNQMRPPDSENIKAYPNPAKEEINLEFEVMKGDAELSVRNQDGKVIFEKKYSQVGKYKENVKLKDSSNKMLIIQLKEDGRIERKKIISD